MILLWLRHAIFVFSLKLNLTRLLKRLARTRFKTISKKTEFEHHDKAKRKGHVRLPVHLPVATRFCLSARSRPRPWAGREGPMSPHKPMVPYGFRPPVRPEKASFSTHTPRSSSCESSSARCVAASGAQRSARPAARRQKLEARRARARCRAARQPRPICRAAPVRRLSR